MNMLVDVVGYLQETYYELLHNGTPTCLLVTLEWTINILA